ncbi:MAG: SusC/RagA family TonB-linked outer membrane protein, partial [Bacteroidetes bacterium]|nr:SusC/RagA family TonB-linked outer membrane protein [Bacteroidota bacterium]
MKKKREVWFPYGDEMKLQFRKMKLTAILLFIVCVTFGNSFSQVRLTVRFDNTNIREVLQTIEEKTDYIFLYKDQIFDFSQKVSADFTDAKFEDVLKSLCDQTNISYEIRDRQIILKEKEATNQNGEQQPQKKSITGKVTDSSGGSIPGVSVVVKGTTIGMITDANGNYSLSNIPVNASLQFSFIGMKSQEVKVGGKTTINVKLEDETVGIEDVVVIGYGTVKKSDLTGSVASIKGNALTVQSAANPMMALQGSASGVRVVSSGEPGTSPIVKIRGVGTTGNSDPLYVVDGMMLDDVNFLNNNDIESIEVLKDASATAIYGSRGANGVILISTKKGSSRKPTFQLNFYEGIQSPQPFDLVTAAEYGQLINEGNIGQGKPPVYPNPEALGKGTQWFKEVTHQSSMRDYQLMFNQKTKNSRYYVSVGYYGNPGIVDKSAYNRYTIRLNNEYNLTDKIKVGHNISFISSSKENLNNDNVFGWLYRVKPTIPVYDENGNFNDVEVGSNGNVVAKIYYTNNNTNTVGAVGNAYLDINFLKDFTFRSSIGINMQNTQQTVFNP